jgi:hypothetical protein
MKYKTLEDTVYFWIGANDTSGSGDDGAQFIAHVRLAGADATDPPLFSLGDIPELSNAAYPQGCYEIAIPAKALNLFEAGEEYAVFCTLLVDSQNPTGFVGSFQLAPVLANIDAIKGTTLTETAAGYLAAAFKKLFNVATPLLVASVAMKGTNLAALATEMLKVPKSDSNVTWNATALASIKGQLAAQLDTEIPGSPTAHSINQRIRAIDLLTEASGDGDLAAIKVASINALIQIEGDDYLVFSAQSQKIRYAKGTLVSPILKKDLKKPNGDPVTSVIDVIAGEENVAL